MSDYNNFWRSQKSVYASSKDGFISHLTYLVQLPYLGKSQNKNDQFRRKQHIVLWINNIKFFQSKYLPGRLIKVLKMWKYRHSVKEDPKSGYDWSANGQQQTAFCVCQREHWLCLGPCAQSGRQSKNAPIESWDLMWNWHSLTDCTQNNLSWSPAQLCQTTSRTAAVWNQSRCPSDSHAAAVRGTVWLNTV